ncbi:Na+/H+ antiporter subunit D [Agrobacterium rosae]|uniref:Na+/H+ antiporter subunit D n=1 Tax=Agrobacterium rosae TaxID=1972867 RepID=A0AAE5RXH8_9HYPH|nr:Na+/H+ antiporter subunit D [Agrobacterium rosae]KAA3514354.1 Na+/H+ antiporter subunit D [Agrobacterium rosae]KAA3523020.1 Na+/H+ antiporter subunit D [Agrobacterium rosae]MCM2433675.1 Na+/H+ antiporter subunit D [Agrobacterium rosae]MDX8329767.1 Na+/H+ antiporter subunit D [Agrobacterium rosae]MQB47729.1 Na+/H+ antiporter subunit D [Agrobacterium rosae]
MAVSGSAPIDMTAALVMQPTPLADWLIVAPVALCISIGAILMMVRHSTRLHAGIAIFGLFLLVVIDAALLWKVATHGPVTMVMGRWLPPFGIAFTADMAGAALALAGAIAALACAVHASADVDDSGRRYGFYPFLMLLMAGVSGAFLTGDIFNLYVWFEVLLVSSFGLIVLGSTKEQIDGALKYAVLNLIGTTLFLIAVGYLYALFGTLNMADIVLKVTAAGEGAPLMTLAALFTLAFAMKAAAFPVNFWLPASYHTPKIVVSALFGGLLTKVGIYALLRVMIMLFPVQRDELSLAIAIVAALTMILGAMGALAQNDIRRMLGYVVISGIGTMLAGVAIGSPSAVAGVVFYALNSVVVMTALYLTIGHAARLGGAWTLSELSGLYAKAHWFSAMALALFFAGSGLPPFSGFWPKAMLTKSAIDIGAWWLATAILVSGFLCTIAFARMFLLCFWRPSPAGMREITVPTQPPSFVPLAALTFLVIGFGLFPEGVMRLSQQAADGLADPSAYIRSVFPNGAAR